MAKYRGQPTKNDDPVYSSLPTSEAAVVLFVLIGALLFADHKGWIDIVKLLKP